MFRNQALSGLVVLCLALAAAAGCAQGVADEERPATAVILPEGDPEEGRRVFMSLGCALCHQASGDRGIPQPASTTLGPVLGPAQSAQSTAQLVDSILNPSHRLPEGMAAEVESPMTEYGDITFRQLSDVVAYVRYLGE